MQKIGWGRGGKPYVYLQVKCAFYWTDSLYGIGDYSVTLSEGVCFVAAKIDQEMQTVRAEIHVHLQLN